MYNKFFGLSEAPFNITPDLKFLYLSQRHCEALSSMLYGIKDRKGFILLTGEIGSGKTTLCRALANDLRQENIHFALIMNPGLSEIEMLKAINDEFQIPSYYDTKKGLVDELNRFLITENKRGGNVALIIDEAQNLTPALLEEIRLLSNLETETEKLIQIVLMGQPELNDTLALSQLEQLNQRIAVRYHIIPLSQDEVLAYIRHRLTVAQAKIEIEFAAPALKMAYQSTRGIPRKINVLFDRVLLACYAEGSYTVDEKIMRQAIQEVSGPVPETEQKPALAAPRVREILRSVMARKIAMGVAVAAAAAALLAGAVAVGVRIANVRGDETQPGAIAPSGPHQSAAADDAAAAAVKSGKAATAGKSAKSAAAPDTKISSTSETLAAKAAPTPTPDLEQIRRRNPNWKYEKNAPLVRVNNPKAVRRAAQLSMLKVWGIGINLDDMPKISEDLIISGELSSEVVKLRQMPVGDEYDKIIRYDVPLILKIKDPAPDQSEYVVMLRAEGEAVTVGDPMWGIKVYKAQDLRKRLSGAEAVFVDVANLSDIKRGETSDRSLSLQQYLKDQKYLDDVTGVFDVKTTEAIKKLQKYYGLKETGNLDDMTLMILNSRLMKKGPRLAGGD
ncbi:MAG: AAA family ATPase [Candidatus Sumerlaeota bacterium]|nr:AAA family ATPase [Candidatus Sumerlaeota bacterium]